MPGVKALPLAGEDVAFTREEKTEIYKVLSVRHHYEGFSRSESRCTAGEKVEVKVERVIGNQG